MDYETAVAALGYFAMLTSAVNFIMGMASSERNTTDSPADDERESGDDGGGWDDYL